MSYLVITYSNGSHLSLKIDDSEKDFLDHPHGLKSTFKDKLINDRVVLVELNQESDDNHCSINSDSLQYILDLCMAMKIPIYHRENPIYHRENEDA